MGRKEEPIRWFYEKNPHFAGLLNGWLFSGKEEIRAEQLTAVDSRYTGRTASGKKSVYRSRYRDIKEQVRNEEGRSNMWVAFRELMEDSKTEGKAEGIREGRSHSVLTLLGELGAVSDDLREKISGESDTALLEDWLKLSARVRSVEDFRRQAQI